MSPRSISVRLAAVRTHAQLLLEHAEVHAGQLNAFVAAAEEDVRQAEAAVSHAADHGVDGEEVRHLLGALLGRSVATATAAKVAPRRRPPAARRCAARSGTSPRRSRGRILVLEGCTRRGRLRRYSRRRGGCAAERRVHRQDCRRWFGGADRRLRDAANGDPDGRVHAGVGRARSDAADQGLRGTARRTLIAYTGNPGFEESPAEDAVRCRPDKAGSARGLVAAVRHTASL